MSPNVSFFRRHRALRCPLMVASSRAPNADAGCAALRLWDVGKTLLGDVGNCHQLSQRGNTFKLPMSSCSLHLSVSLTRIAPLRLLPFSVYHGGVCQSRGKLPTYSGRNGVRGEVVLILKRIYTLGLSLSSSNLTNT